MEENVLTKEDLLELKLELQEDLFNFAGRIEAKVNDTVGELSHRVGLALDRISRLEGQDQGEKSQMQVGFANRTAMILLLGTLISLVMSVIALVMH